MTHHFPFDPREVLGVSADATPDQLHDAYREKSRKHHPDRGGDEWAFRMVARAYAVLKEAPEEVPPAPEPPPWLRPGASEHFFQGRFPFGSGSARPREGEEPDETWREPPRAEPPAIFRWVDVELIWIHFGGAGAAADRAEGATLSVCLVVSWPLRSLVARAAEYAHLDGTLHRVIDAFDAARETGPMASRSRIEDGQFVGWLSFPDVPAAQIAFLRLRDDLRHRGLTVGLRTRDEIVPETWTG